MNMEAESPTVAQIKAAFHKCVSSTLSIAPYMDPLLVHPSFQSLLCDIETKHEVILKDDFIKVLEDCKLTLQKKFESYIVESGLSKNLKAIDQASVEDPLTVAITEMKLLELQKYKLVNENLQTGMKQLNEERQGKAKEMQICNEELIAVENSISQALGVFSFDNNPPRI